MKINKKFTLIAALISLTSMNYGFGEYEGSALDNNFGFRRSTESSRPTMPEYEEQQRAAELRTKDQQLENEKRFANRTTLHYSPTKDEQPVSLERPQDTRTTWKKVKDFFNDLFFDGRTAKKSIDSYTSKVLRGDSETVLNEQEKEAFMRLSDKAQLKYINRFTDAINDARQKELKSDSQALVAQQTTLETAQKQFLSDQSEARAQIVKNIKDSLNSIAPKGSTLRSTAEYKALTQSILDKKTTLQEIQTNLTNLFNKIPTNNIATNRILSNILDTTSGTITTLNDKLTKLNQDGHKYNLARRQDKIEIEKKYNDKLEKFYTELNNTVFRTGKQIIYNTDTGKAEFYMPESNTYEFNETLANRPENKPENAPISSEPTSPNTYIKEERNAQIVQNFMEIVNNSSKSNQLRLDAINTLKKTYGSSLSGQQKARINKVLEELKNQQTTTETPYALGTAPQPVRQTTATDFTESNTSTATYPTYRPKANFDELLTRFQKDNEPSATTSFNDQSSTPFNTAKTKSQSDAIAIQRNLNNLKQTDKPNLLAASLRDLSSKYDQLTPEEKTLFKNTVDNLLTDTKELTPENLTNLNTAKTKLNTAKNIAL